MLQQTYEEENVAGLVRKVPTERSRVPKHTQELQAVQLTQFRALLRCPSRLPITQYRLQGVKTVRFVLHPRSNPTAFP